MAEPPPLYMVPCVKSDCDPTTDTCNITCFYSHTEPPPHATSQSHVAPFLIATVCILGISFLLLTTCTIILRFRFTRRRNSNVSPNNSAGSPIDDDDDHAVIDHPIWHITTVGLQQSVIDSITTFKYKKLDSLLAKGSDCSVCLSQFDDGDDLRLLPKCCHAFHVNCIDTWLRSHKNCPLCRTPVVNESFTARSGSFAVIAEDLESSGEVLGEASGSAGDNSGGAGGCGELPLEGIRIAEVLKKNRELRILSDLAVNYRFNRDIDEGNDPIRRSFSFNALAATAICGAVSSKGKSEGSSSGEHTATAGGGNGGGVEEKSVESKASKRGTSMSGLLMLKRPVSMKRSPSTSSNGRLFSFRRSKSQASILPL